MRSIFYLRRTIALTKTLAVSPEHALEFLHDPPSMIMRSLVAFSFKEITSSQSGLDSSLESKYAITDFVPMFFGLFNTKTTVTATFKHNPDGTCMRVEALVGTQLKTTWNVKEVSVGVHKEGQLEGTLLTEVIEVTVSNFALANCGWL